MTSLHTCPVCLHDSTFADLTDFEDEGNYWLHCRNCGVEWNVWEEPDQVLERLRLVKLEVIERGILHAR